MFLACSWLCLVRVIDLVRVCVRVLVRVGILVLRDSVRDHVSVRDCLRASVLGRSVSVSAFEFIAVKVSASVSESMSVLTSPVCNGVHVGFLTCVCVRVFARVRVCVRVRVFVGLRGRVPVHIIVHVRVPGRVSFRGQVRVGNRVHVRVRVSVLVRVRVRISLGVSDRIGGGMPVFVVLGSAIVSPRPCECLSVRLCALHRVMHFS